MKRLAILGSTGSIGKQALEVVDANPDLFSVEILTANNNAELLIKQALKYKPRIVVIANEEKYDVVSEALDIKGISVFAGNLALQQVVQDDNIDMVLAAMVGYSGLLPVINAIKAKKEIALANKETLVVAGDIITRLCNKYNVKIYPVDSEHSAIFQCLAGETNNQVEKIIITCSGGPFRSYSRQMLENVTSKQALAHPNWDMGAKITIDSATLMNKGFEVIEAKWLFDLSPDQIDVVVHPQSIIHSMVQFTDGSIKAQMGLPDMRLPIQYALCYPLRQNNNFKRFSFTDYPELTFSAPDTKNFSNLAIAYHALRKGGNMACTINAANEIAVQAFLDDKLKFLQISEVIEQCTQKIAFIAQPTIDDYIETDFEARNIATEIIRNIK
ncbi:MAG TPA: 1-deoxy-D-xylulose-5-phosphate reductoisomerase [Prolixibacteraceae bacterium]|nr:1-deoxy-D-xylulose-5-phosphate reductoisomerase [Prolixibacteraceae bacterium]